MMNVLFSAFVLFVSCNKAQSELAEEGIFAEIQTNKGTITVKLEYEKTPVTVANFISLAEGTNIFVEDQFKGKPFYNGLKFHRVIADFMIQGGCPLGIGNGHPGYKFADEITDLKHNRAGTLSMANSGPATNGSQFFITHKNTDWLDGKHTVFGYVTQGQDIVNAIAQDDSIQKVTIIRKGKKAESFDAIKTFSEYFKKEAEAKREAEVKAEKIKAEKRQFFDSSKAKATKTKSGLAYVIIEKGGRIKPTQDQDVFVSYSGYLEDGSLFDTSNAEIAKAYGTHDPQREQSGGYRPFPYKLSNKTGLIPGFLEGLEQLNFGDKAILYIPAHLGYGERGTRGIPPNANLIFEVQLLEKM